MTESDLDRAVALAKAVVGIDDRVPVKTTPVRRLDGNGTYVIVQLGQPGDPGWVVAVDVNRREVMTWAANESGETTVPTQRPSNLSAADADAEWVWSPSRSSPSPLYPLLRISNDEGEWFVDLSGRVSSNLSDGRA